VHLKDIFVDKTNRQLTLGDENSQLEPKVNLLLHTLINANGDIVCREQLIEQVWQGRVVGDGAINRTVSLLRQHLAALDSENNYIVTVPKAGYKLLHINKSQLAPQIKQSSANQIKWPLIFILSITGFVVLLAMLFWFNSQPTVSFNKTNRITAQFGAEYNVSVDKTGDNLLYQHFDNKTLLRKLYLFNADLNTDKLILNKHINTATISPDNQLLSISYQNNEQCHLGVYDLATKVIKNIQKCASDSLINFSWHWNSQDLYFRDRDNKTQAYSINRYNLKTGRNTLITLPPSHGNLLGDYLLDHHPNKNWLLIARYIDESNTLLLILDSFTNEIKFSYQVPHHINALAWLDKEYASFSEQGSIYLINVLTGDIRFKFKNSHSINSMDSTQHSLVYSTLERASHVIKHNIATGKRIIIDKNNAIAQLPKITENGKLTYLSNKQSSFQWQLSDGKNISTIDIKLPFDLKFDRYEWSKDGRYILIAKHGSIYQIDTDKNEYQKLTNNEIAAFVVNYDPDGNIIYSSNSSGQWQLWLYRIKEETHNMLTHHGGYSGRIKDKNLFFTKFNENGLWKLNLTTGEEQNLIADFDIINWLNWQLINNNIYFYRPDSGVWKYELETAKETLILSPPERFLHQFTVTPDENTLYFVESKNIEGDIYKVPFTIN
jgi:DNA-binding winged helix-turn-helix (wHTH) protein